MWGIAISMFLLFVLAGIGKAVGDTLQFHWGSSIFPKLGEKYPRLFNPYWWCPIDPYDSWKNKYKNRDSTQGRAFFGSKTFLVFLTDGWHMAEFVMLNSFTMAASIGVSYFTQIFFNILPGDYARWDWFIIFLVLSVGRSLGFNVFFDRILVQK